jgi:hypothetical protein
MSSIFKYIKCSNRTWLAFALRSRDLLYGEKRFQETYKWRILQSSSSWQVFPKSFQYYNLLHQNLASKEVEPNVLTFNTAIAVNRQRLAVVARWKVKAFKHIKLFRYESAVRSHKPRDHPRPVHLDCLNMLWTRRDMRNERCLFHLSTSKFCRGAVVLLVAFAQLYFPSSLTDSIIYAN